MSYLRKSMAARAFKYCIRILWPRIASRFPGFLANGTIVDDVIVSLTTYGPRLNAVDATIFSILTGKIRPSKLILVLNENLPGKVESRLKFYYPYGLEILRSEDLGPHKKYYPVIQSDLIKQECLVTADDDIFYDRNWLFDLYSMHVANPNDVICGWAKNISVVGDAVGPYASWDDVTGTEAAAHHFAIGCAGTLYPPSMVSALKVAGLDFLECCPRADDVWLHATALRTGHLIRQVRSNLRHPVHLPGTQDSALKITNHLPNGNDKAIKSTYSHNDVLKIVYSNNKSFKN